MPSTLRIEAPTFYPGARTLPSPPSSVPSPVDDTWATFALSFRTRDGEGQVAVAYSTTPPIEILQTENMRKLVSGKGVHGVVELGQTGRKEVEVSSPLT